MAPASKQEKAKSTPRNPTVLRILPIPTLLAILPGHPPTELYIRINGQSPPHPLSLFALTLQYRSAARRKMKETADRRLCVYVCRA